jgi:hypothetical protein
LELQKYQRKIQYGEFVFEILLYTVPHHPQHLEMRKCRVPTGGGISAKLNFDTNDYQFKQRPVNIIAWQLKIKGNADRLRNFR